MDRIDRMEEGDSKVAEGDSPGGTPSHRRHEDESLPASPASGDLGDLHAAKGADIFSHEVENVRRVRDGLLPSKRNTICVQESLTLATLA